MAVTIGLDIGSASVKLAALGERSDSDRLSKMADACPDFFLAKKGPPSADGEPLPLLLSHYRRIHGRPAPSILCGIRQ